MQGCFSGVLSAFHSWLYTHVADVVVLVVNPALFCYVCANCQCTWFSMCIWSAEVWLCKLHVLIPILLLLLYFTVTCRTVTVLLVLEFGIGIKTETTHVYAFISTAINSIRMLCV